MQAWHISLFIRHIGAAPFERKRNGDPNRNYLGKLRIGLCRIAICVFLKTKSPKIRWRRTDRNPQQVTEYLEKAEVVARQIEEGVFYSESASGAASAISCSSA
jgi:hypothetical protein